jgi:hypothetical protein
MKKAVFGLSVLLVLVFVLAGCDNGTNGTTGNGYDGFGVWLVTENNYNAIKAANWEGQPKPSAIAHIPSPLGDTFTADFYDPQNFNPDSSDDTIDGWWNIGEANTPWTAASGDYYVLIFPYKIYPYNFEWIWDEGKISGSGSTASKLGISANPSTFTLANFINISW